MTKISFPEAALITASLPCLVLSYFICLIMTVTLSFFQFLMLLYCVLILSVVVAGRLFLSALYPEKSSTDGITVAAFDSDYLAFRF